MLIDLEQEAATGIYRSQVCVLGAGIAGLVLAQRLAAEGLEVHLLEAGGLDLEERSQTLYAVEQQAERHSGATEGRFRVFGGSSTRWGGQLLPFTEDIFSPGSAMPSAVWPIAAKEIEPHYGRVLEIMGVDRLPFGAELLPALGHAKVELGSNIDLRFSKWAPFRRRNLAKSLGTECISHDKVTVFTHANVMALQEDAGRVIAAKVNNYTAGEFRFEAEQFVVCLGTIESSRLLLLSGVGNAYDQVGRYFHDHVSVRTAEMTGRARAQMLERFGPFFVEGTLHTCKFEASAALRQSEGLPAVMAHMVIEEPDDSGVGAVRGILRALQQGDLLRAVSKHLSPMISGLGDVARLIWASKVRRRRAVSARAKVWLHIDQEQVAGPEDRIGLSASLDALGQRRAVVAWRVGEKERRTAQRFAEVLRSELEALGFRGIVWKEHGVITDTYHPMGGLRMGLDPQVSVVDTELRVHGIENLHVASCAVFPAGGSSNPTYTMMALTLRLAARLTQILLG